jgi:hypothetical protein
MKEIRTYSDTFILSQYEYYKKHLGSRIVQVTGLFQYYEAEAKRRKLL